MKWCADMFGSSQVVKCTCHTRPSMVRLVGMSSYYCIQKCQKWSLHGFSQVFNVCCFLWGFCAVGQSVPAPESNLLPPSSCCKSDSRRQSPLQESQISIFIQFFIACEEYSKNTQTLIDASKKVGLEVNVEKTSKCWCLGTRMQAKIGE
jgi:hypothetical protein